MDDKYLGDGGGGSVDDLQRRLRPRALPMLSATSASSAVADAGGVLRDRDLLCFSGDFTGDPLSRTHVMRLLSKENRVLWINSIGYRAPTASRSDLSRLVNKLVAAAEPVK